MGDDGRVGENCAREDVGETMVVRGRIVHERMSGRGWACRRSDCDTNLGGVLCLDFLAVSQELGVEFRRLMGSTCWRLLDRDGHAISEMDWPYLFPRFPCRCGCGRA